MTQPLWSDKRIGENAKAHSLYNIGGEIKAMSVATAHSLLTNMRDEYEAALANQYQRIERLVELVDQLEAQLAAARPSSEVSDTITRSLVSSESINDTYTWMRRVDAATKWINVLRGKE